MGPHHTEWSPSHRAKSSCQIVCNSASLKPTRPQTAHQTSNNTPRARVWQWTVREIAKDRGFDHEIMSVSCEPSLDPRSRNSLPFRSWARCSSPRLAKKKTLDDLYLWESTNTSRHEPRSLRPSAKLSVLPLQHLWSFCVAMDLKSLLRGLNLGSGVPSLSKLGPWSPKHGTSMMRQCQGSKGGIGTGVALGGTSQDLNSTSQTSFLGVPILEEASERHCKGEQQHRCSDLVA